MVVSELFSKDVSRRHKSPHYSSRPRDHGRMSDPGFWRSTLIVLLSLVTINMAATVEVQETVDQPDSTLTLRYPGPEAAAAAVAQEAAGKAGSTLTFSYRGSGEATAGPQCKAIKPRNRFDCWPEGKGVNKEVCEKRGCCWDWESEARGPAPYCYFPSDYGGYTASNVTVSSLGVSATLTRKSATIFPPDVKTLQLRIDFQTKSRLRIKIFDPNSARFEPPVEVPSGSIDVRKPLYKVHVTKSPFNIAVTRAATNATIFDTNGVAPFIFADQFLQVGTRLATHYLYGLGEHRYNFMHNVTDRRKLVFWNNGEPPTEKNGYGSQPFFLNLEKPHAEGDVPNAHGVLFLNSNAAEAALQPFGHDKRGAVTFRSIGGIVDIFLLLGDTPLSVSAQYAQMVGTTYMPPFWALGFHLCRWGYNSSANLKAVIKRNRAANIPYDTQWGDIDYMDDHKDWTYSHAFHDLPDVVEDLHKHKQRYIIMADPAISSTQKKGTYPPFDDGKKMGIFMKDHFGKILIGEVWPGETAFPDFFHPKAYDYWYKQVKEFHAKVPFDGLWIDMNEPESFIEGSTKGCSKTLKYDNPPYIPATIFGGNLTTETLCPSAKHSLSEHYNLHNMYGWSQSNVSRGALNTLYGNKRSPIISRSTYVGSGKFAGHWLGDNWATYSDMAFSISGVLNFNLFGIPLVGADICGFGSNTTPELCTRWHQLGAFYPFMRNHNRKSTVDQDPGSFQSPYVDHIRKALELRYSLLAVLYTGFYKAHTEGLPIVRPLFYIFPGTEAISHQFMWGDQLLVSPVLTQNATTVEAFIPRGVWYDFYSGKRVDGPGKKVTLHAPLDTINVHIRGGSILPLLPPTERTDVARAQKFTVVVAPDASGSAEGELFWDDGESADSIQAKKFSLLEFKLKGNTLEATATVAGYVPENGILAAKVVLLGVTTGPSTVTVNGDLADFRYEALENKLTVFDLSLNLLKAAKVTWK